MLPIAVLPDWARNPSQPIAIDDLVAYLVEALDVETDGSEIFEIGGADRVPYTAILEEYARQSGVRRVLATAPVPRVAARLGATVKGLGPRRARIVSELAETLGHDTSVQDTDALERFSVRPRGLGEAVAAALTDRDRR